MNIIFHKEFINAFKSLPANHKTIIIQQVCYFSRNPAAGCFQNQAIYTPGLKRDVRYLVNVGRGYKAAYHLADDEAALFIRLYEQPVVLPQELQT